MKLSLMSDVSGVGNISETDSEVDIVPRLLGNNSLWLNGLNDSDTDSDDEDFRAGENAANDDNDTDSLTGIDTTLKTKFQSIPVGSYRSSRSLNVCHQIVTQFHPAQVLAQLPELLVDRNLIINFCVCSLTTLSILHISSFTVTGVPKPHGYAHVFDSARSDILCVSVSMSVCYSVVC